MNIIYKKFFFFFILDFQPQSKKKKDKERCTSLIEKLIDEEKRQTDHVQRVMARLKHEKDSWFLCSKSLTPALTASVATVLSVFNSHPTYFDILAHKKSKFLLLRYFFWLSILFGNYFYFVNIFLLLKT